jgi:hypothetical protein
MAKKTQNRRQAATAEIKMKRRAYHHRLRQIEKILSLFEDVHRRPARTIEKLDAWVGSPEGSRYLDAFRDTKGKIIRDY